MDIIPQNRFNNKIFYHFLSQNNRKKKQKQFAFYFF